MTTFEPADLGGYLMLGDIIERLEREDPDRVLPLGFANPHSFRGIYSDLAFEPVRNIRIGDMLAAARSALGATYTAWKGGDYTMDALTDCWIALRGDSGDDKIGPLLLTLLLAQPAADHHARLAAGTEWVCEGCGYHNNGGICTHCGRPAAGTEEG